MLSVIYIFGDLPNFNTHNHKVTIENLVTYVCISKFRHIAVKDISKITSVI